MDYFNFCVNNTVSIWTVRCFPNIKARINSNIKALLEEKRGFFIVGYKEVIKAVQKELMRKIKEGKDSYRKKTEDQLQ